MPNYQPFLISDLTEGKVTRRDRWSLSPDGFADLTDCHLKRGVLEKRRGKSKLGQIVKVDTETLNPTLQTNPVMGIWNHLSGNTEQLIVFDKERMNTIVSGKWSSVSLLSVADLGGSPNLVRFTVSSADASLMTADDITTISNWSTYDGTYRVEAVGATSFDIEHAYTAEAPPATAAANQEQFTDATENKIRFMPTGTGIDQDASPGTGDTVYGVTSGATAVLAEGGTINDYGLHSSGTAYGTYIFDSGTITGDFVDGEQLNSTGTIDTGDIYGYANGANSDGSFTGDNTDYFWVENWTLGGESKTYITNNHDPLQVYDGTHLSQFSIDIGLTGDRDGDNDVNSALLVFVIKERIVLFSTNENGTDYNQRARWSAIKEPDSWPTSSFIDAPTEDYIVAADFLGDDIYVWFEHSVWRFAYTGDSVTPFEWQRVSAQDGAIAQMSLTTRNNIQRAIGPTKILSNNGNIVGHIDQKIPDVVLDWNPDSAPYSVSADAEENRRIYFTYARTETLPDGDGNQYPDRALIYNYEDNNWAVHKHEIHTMGFSSLESDVTWDLDAAWEDIDFAWNSSNTTSGFPFTLIGDHDGIIFQLSVGGSDEGDDISFNATTARFNPFNKQGSQAKFWKVEFLCDVDEDIKFDVSLFLNTDSSAYSTTTVTCEPIDGSSDKAWYAVFSDTVGTFHSLNISNDASNNRPRIHAMRFWFKPVGNLT